MTDLYIGVLLTVCLHKTMEAAQITRTQPHDETSSQPGIAGLFTYEGVTKNFGLISSKESRYKTTYSDPEWKYQWYLHDYRAPNSRYPVMDHNVVPVHKMGVTGLGVTVAVVDDGVDHEHDDLAPNFDYKNSYDMLAEWAGSQPRDTCVTGIKEHGTMVAGIIGMVANNHECGVGIAYHAKIVSIRLFGLPFTPQKEHDALIKNLENIDIYSNSFGSNHGADSLDGSIGLYFEALEKGVTKGRNGKGAIYVLGTGNAKDQNDHCATDKFVNHPFVIPIGAATQMGKLTPYSERCAAVMATAYSGGWPDKTEGIMSTKMFGGCTRNFRGTSASTPIASAIIALALQANKDLTYRDVMHLIAMTSEVAPLADNPDTWRRNAAGFWVSNDFGFGLLNAQNMVLAAHGWMTLPTPRVCVVDVVMKNKGLKVKKKLTRYLATFTKNKPAVVEFETDACLNKPGEGVRFLEKVELWTSVKYSYRGSLSISITSPEGTDTTLLEPRVQDTSRYSFSGWRFTSVQNWGENPEGTWKFNVKVNLKKSFGKTFTDTLLEGFKDTGIVYWMQLVLRGTEYPPDYVTDLPRAYTGFRLEDGRTSEDPLPPRKRT